MNIILSRNGLIKELVEMASIYNKSALISEEWLHSYLILKAGKNHTKTQEHQIITTQNVIGKLLEQITARNIPCQLEE